MQHTCVKGRNWRNFLDAIMIEVGFQYNVDGKEFLECDRRAYWSVVCRDARSGGYVSAIECLRDECPYGRRGIRKD